MEIESIGETKLSNLKEAGELPPWKLANVNRKTPKSFDVFIVEKLRGKTIWQLAKLARRIPVHYRRAWRAASKAKSPAGQEAMISKATILDDVYTKLAVELRSRHATLTPIL
jgi:hypothetical protein